MLWVFSSINFSSFTSWSPVIMKYCRHDPLGEHGSDGVGRYLPRQLAPIATGDVHDDGAVAGQLLGAE